MLWTVLLIHAFVRIRWSYFFLSHSLSPHLQYVGLLLVVDIFLALCLVFSLLYFKRGSLYFTLSYSVLLLIVAYFTWGFDAIAGVFLLFFSAFAIFKKVQLPVQTIRSWKAFYARVLQIIFLLSVFVNIAFFIALHA